MVGTAVRASQARTSWGSVRPWAGLVVRLALAGIALWAGVAKLSDPEASVRAVRAYELLPGGLADVAGYGLPVIEVVLGLLLLGGLLTRPAAVANGLLMLAFIGAVASAWARGLSIECGCFGGGGAVDPDQTQYLSVILRNLAIVAGSAFLVRWPRTRGSVDAALRL